MLEYIVIFGIVAIAAIYTGRKIFRQTRGHGCEGCNCGAQANKADQLVQIKPLNPKKNPNS